MKNHRIIKYITLYCLALLVSAGVLVFAKDGLDSNHAATATPSAQITLTDVVTPTFEAPEPTSEPSPTAEPATPTAPPTPTETIPADAWEQLGILVSDEWKELVGERCIIMDKPEACLQEGTVETLLEDLAVNRSIRLTLRNCAETEITEENLQRIAGELFFTGESKEGDPLEKLTVYQKTEEDKSTTLVLEMKLNSTYVYRLYETEEQYFISLIPAKQVYGKIIVLDAGHGGWDNGTSSADGRYREKDMNLSILLKLKALLDQEEDITVYCTRTTDCFIALSDRIALANNLNADFFLSIHCNNAYQNPNANGTEVLYTEFQNDWSGVNSKKFAQLCLEELISALQLSNRGLFKRGTNLTVLNEAKVPAALAEIGFMSNESDLQVIIDESKQELAAEALYKAVLKALELKGNE